MLSSELVGVRREYRYALAHDRSQRYNDPICRQSKGISTSKGDYDDEEEVEKVVATEGKQRNN